MNHADHAELQASIHVAIEQAQKGPGLKLLTRGLRGKLKPTKHCDRCQCNRYTPCRCKPRRGK
jgi:hypothetical protein